MNDEIIELLENSELRQKVITAIQKVWSFAGTLYDNRDEDMEKYVEENKEASLWEEAWWRAETFGEIHKIEQAFDKYVIEKMAKPHRLTLDELVTAFFDFAQPDERHIEEFEEFNPEDCNNLYMLFVYYVKNHILSYRHSDPSPICAITRDDVSERYIRGMVAGYQIAMSEVEGKTFESKNLDEEVVEDEKPLWDKNGISLRLLRGTEVIDATPAGKKLYHILALIEGNISVSACRNLQTEMGRILTTAIRSADLLQTTGFGNGKIIGNIGHGAFLTFLREIEGLPWGEEGLLENANPLIRQYLDAFYSEPTKKDSFDRRIRNAVCLLIELDNQSNNAVGLALSITAIEALIGEKGPEVTVKLADNVAALLEPDTSQRYNATEFVKDLYDTRSRALHGELVETESKARIDARHLAATVLSGVISRRDFLRRSGYEPETPQDLLKDLRESRFTTGQPMGVPEFNVRELWRNRTSGKKDSSL
jgi:hypothetical protein